MDLLINLNIPKIKDKSDITHDVLAMGRMTVMRPDANDSGAGEGSYIGKNETWKHAWRQTGF